MTVVVKRYIGFGVLAGLIVMVILGINYYSSHVGTFVVAEIIPKDSSVQIDDKKPGKVGNIKTTPGDHTLTVKRNGFADQTIKVTVGLNEKKRVRKMLVPNSRIGFDWVKKHPKEVALGESWAGEEFNANSLKATERTPIVKKLPFIDREYRIDYGKSAANPEDITATAIYITTYAPTGKTQALELIRFWGYDPASLEIIYKFPDTD